MKKIICVHLFNDYSGSPLVLSTAIRSFMVEGLAVEVVTSGSGIGFLSDISGVKYRPFKYRFFENKVLRLLALLWAQVAMFCRVLLHAKGDTVVYVNTLLPFGAALAGKLLGKKVVYHLHETTVNPPALKGFLRKMANTCASEAVYVSNFLMEQEALPGVPSKVVYNCLSPDFIEKAEAYLAQKPSKDWPFTVLMLCSLKEYKGVNEFVQLAGQLPDFRFVMVLNSDADAVSAFFRSTNIPENLVIFPAQQNVHSFYQEAHLVLNLSHPEKWIETFGMTLLEAMSYGLPVIAPPVGGPVELVKDGHNGYKMDQRNIQVMAQKVAAIREHPGLYDRMSANASAFAAQFSERQFRQELLKAVA